MGRGPAGGSTGLSFLKVSTSAKFRGEVLGGCPVRNPSTLTLWGFTRPKHKQGRRCTDGCVLSTALGTPTRPRQVQGTDSHTQQVPGSSTWPCLFPSHHHPRACSHARQPCPIISVHLAAEERHAPWSPWAPTAVSQMQALVNATPVPTAPSSSGAACPGHSPHPANWPLQGEHPAFSPCFLYKLRFGMTSPSQ